MDVKTRLINYYNSNEFIKKYIKGMNSVTNEIVLSYNGLTKNISIDDLENINDETSVISFLNDNTYLREAEEPKFYKKNESDTIWWVNNPNEKGKMEFTFDKKTIYNLYQDYKNLPQDLKEIFNKENPYWDEYFNGKKETPSEEQQISMVEPKVINSELDKETLNDIKILTEIKSKSGLDNLLKDFAVNESTGLIDINKALSIVEKNTIDEVIKSIKEHYDFDLDLQNYDKTGKYIGNKTASDRLDDEKIMSSFNNIKVYLDAASMYVDQVQFTEEDINKKMKEYIDKVKSILNPVKEVPRQVNNIASTEQVSVNQSAGFADIFVLCLIVIVYAIIIVNLILKLS